MPKTAPVRTDVNSNSHVFPSKLIAEKKAGPKWNISAWVVMFAAKLICDMSGVIMARWNILVDWVRKGGGGYHCQLSIFFDCSQPLVFNTFSCSACCWGPSRTLINPKWFLAKFEASKYFFSFETLPLIHHLNPSHSVGTTQNLLSVSRSEELSLQKIRCSCSETYLYLMGRRHFWRSGGVEYSFIAITPRSTRSGCTC